MAMRWIPHAAMRASCLSAGGGVRSVATAVGIGECTPDATLRAHAKDIGTGDGTIGKVHASGTFQEPAVHTKLAAALGAPLGSALRPDFEWYFCRGAFFHNDAHYDARLFGVWCIDGPPIEFVFPRAAVRVAGGPGTLVVFDPFEIHGVLAPGCGTYAPSDYQSADASVFLGFELDITTDVADVFDIQGGIDCDLVISSRTCIDATTGAL